MNTVDHQPALDLLWGVASIGEYIRKTPRQTLYLLETGQIPAEKVGRQWVSSKQRLNKRFATITGEAA